MSSKSVASPDSMDPQIGRELDKVKSHIFMRTNSAAFLGSILCSVNFVWSRDVPTAATNGLFLWFNPDFFMASSAVTRRSALMHELWHIARMHMLRGKGKNFKVWAKACDYRINNDMDKDGDKFPDFPALVDRSLDDFGVLAEEQIYEKLMKDPLFHSHPYPMCDDMESLTSPEEAQVIGNVIRAIQQARISGKPGAVPGGLEDYINKFLEPVVPWQSLLMGFFTAMLDEQRTWHRPSRRYSDIYMPSMEESEGRLACLDFFMDISGSVSHKMIVRMMSEVKYLQEVLMPLKLRIICFDTKIQTIHEFTFGQEFKEIKIIGRGGTHLGCVADMIDADQPTAAVVFSDMDCDPMRKLKYNTPVFWIAVDAPNATFPFGTGVHINS